MTLIYKLHDSLNQVLVDPFIYHILPLLHNQDIHNLFIAGTVSRGLIRNSVDSIQITLPLSAIDNWMLETMYTIKNINITSTEDYKKLKVLERNAVKSKYKLISGVKFMNIRNFASDRPIPVSNVASELRTTESIALSSLVYLKSFECKCLIYDCMNRVIVPRSCTTLILHNYGYGPKMRSPKINYMLILKAYGITHYQGPVFSTNEADVHTGALVTKLCVLGDYRYLPNIIHSNIISLKAQVVNWDIDMESLSNLKYLKLQTTINTPTCSMEWINKVEEKITAKRGVCILLQKSGMPVLMIYGPNENVNRRVKQW